MPTKQQIEQLKRIQNPLYQKKYAKFLQLPKNLQQTMFAVETADIVWKIANDNNLTSEQLWYFSYLIGMILLGDLHITEFVKKIEQDCKLSPEASRQLARQANQELFLPLKDNLKTVHRIPKWPQENEVMGQQPSGQFQRPTPPTEQPARLSPAEEMRKSEEESRTINLKKEL